MLLSTVDGGQENIIKIKVIKTDNRRNQYLL